MRNKKRVVSKVLVVLVVITCIVGVSGCASMEVKQYGLEGKNTIALNLTKDPNVGTIYVTHVNGEATGGEFSSGFLGFGAKSVYINPLYVKLTGKPIIFTIWCPVYVGRKVQYKKAELRLTKLSDLKAGDVITLKWMYQTQTFVFMDATGNIIQQTIPQFE